MLDLKNRALAGIRLGLLNFIRPLMISVLLCLAVFGASAQDPETQIEVGSTEVEALYERAETAIEEAKASVSAFEELRGQLSDVRDRSKSISDRGSIEVRGLRAQLEALGPPPEVGATEPSWTAQRRAMLEDRLAEAEVPILIARETLQRTNLLLGELDALIEQKTTERLLERYPTPLLPSAWQEAGSEAIAILSTIVKQFKDLFARPAAAETLRHSGPLAAIQLLFGAFIILFLQKRLLGRIRRLLTKSSGMLRQSLLSIFYNLGMLAIPGVGLLFMASGWSLLDLSLPAVPNLSAVLAAAIVFLIIARWLGHTLFAPGFPQHRLFPFDDEQAELGASACFGIGIVLAFDVFATLFGTTNRLSPETVSIVSFLIFLAAAYYLLRLAKVLRSGSGFLSIFSAADDADDNADTGFLKILSFLISISAIAGVALALVGYIELARYAITPMILTIACLGLAYFLYFLVLFIFKAIFGEKEDESATLLLVSAGVVVLLAIVFIPLIALFWGATIADIQSIWRTLADGVSIGEIQLSLDVVITLAIVFTVGMLVTRWLQRVLQVSLLPRTRMDDGAQTAIVTGFGYIGFGLAALIAVSTAGLNLSSLAVVFGALSVGIGFGLQAIVSNFVSGMILLIERPVKVGDWVEVGGYSGFIRKISVRSTRIETFDKHDVVIPNSDFITGAVTNMTLSSKVGRLIIPVGVAYGSDIDATRKILLEAAETQDGVLSHPEPVVLFMGLGDNSLDFEVRCYLRDVGALLGTRSEMLVKIYRDLNTAGIEIPFPQRDIHLRDIDRLLGAFRGEGAETNSG